jgi:hypothetical protein
MNEAMIHEKLHLPEMERFDRGTVREISFAARNA